MNSNEDRIDDCITVNYVQPNITELLSKVSPSLRKSAQPEVVMLRILRFNLIEEMTQKYIKHAGVSNIEPSISFMRKERFLAFTSAHDIPMFVSLSDFTDEVLDMLQWCLENEQ